MMYARSPRAGYSTVSALWNAAYDAGMAPARSASA